MTYVIRKDFLDCKRSAAPAPRTKTEESPSTPGDNSIISPYFHSTLQTSVWECAGVVWECCAICAGVVCNLRSTCYGSGRLRNLWLLVILGITSGLRIVLPTILRMNAFLLCRIMSSFVASA